MMKQDEINGSRLSPAEIRAQLLRKQKEAKERRDAARREREQVSTTLVSGLLNLPGTIRGKKGRFVSARTAAKQAAVKVGRHA
jgi:hypothetical protein